MNEPAALAWSVVVFAGGVALGGVYFGGLWLTMRNVPRAAGNPLLVALSFMVRTAVVLIGFYWLTVADWRYVLVCLAGFLLARWVIIEQVFRSQPSRSISRESTDHDRVAG